MKTKSLLFGLILLSAISCNEGENQDGEGTQIEQQSSVLELGIELLDELSDIYPPEDLTLRVSRDDRDGSVSAVFSLTDESKKAAQSEHSATHVSERAQVAADEGTTCTTYRECDKAITRCFDNGLDALISQGPCDSRKHCVTCQ